METAEFCCLLALLPLLYCLTTLFHGSRDSDLRLPPGPWRLPHIGSIHHLFGALPHRALRDLARRHGPLMLLSFGQAPVVIASMATAAREIMRTHDDNFCTRPLSTVMKVCTRYGSGMTFAPYGEHWRQVRKICHLELLSPRRILAFRTIREEEVVRLLLTIASSTSAPPPALVNLSELLRNYMTDTTVHIIMGQRFREHDTLLRYVNEAVQLAGSLTIADLFPSSRLARAMCTTLHRAEVFVESLMEFMDRVISEHLEKRSCQGDLEEDLIDVVLGLQVKGNLQFELTTSIIKAVVFELFGGGSEAPATILQWAMAELMRNPDVMSRAQAEVREAYQEKMKVTEEGLTNLSYLHCIIKETLRLHTPGPFAIPRECQEQCQILGYDVPKRATYTVLVNIWAICRDTEIWDEPEKFIPERFEGSTIEHKGNNFEFIPFGAGRRICPGMHFVFANMELALASLLFYFDWRLPEDILPNDMDMTETMGLTASRKEDLYVCATPFIQLP